MATFAAAAHQVRADWNFVSAWDLHKPDKGEKLYKPLGDQLLTDLLDLVGNSVPTTSLQYSHFEEDWIMPKIKATTAGAAAGAVATFTIDATADLELGMGATPYGGTPVVKEKVPVRVGDRIKIKPISGVVSASSYVESIVLAVTVGATAGTSTFTAQPIDSADVTPVIAAATEIIIVGNAHGEGSIQPKGMNSKVTEYKNQLQTVKETFQRSGIEGDMVTWIQVKDSNGKAGYVWRIKGEDDAFKRFVNNRELVMLTGEKLANTALADTFATAETPLSLTEGLIPYALGGVVQNYNLAGGLTLTDLNDIVRELDKNKGSMENLLLCGFNLSIAIDALLKDRYTAGAIVYGNYNFGQDASVNMQFDSFKIGNYSFHKKTFSPFNELQGLGADGYGYVNEGIIIPMDNKKDAKSGDKIPSLRKRYLADSHTFTNKEFDVTLFDGFKHAGDGQDIVEVRYKSYCGFEGFGQKRFGYIKAS